jgi:DNA polymerase III delta subunit
VSGRSPSARLAYFWGEDAFAIERAVADLAALAGEPDAPLGIWRSSSDDDGATEGSDASGGTASKRRARLLDEAAARIGTAPLFGGGTLVVIRQPGAILRESVARERLLGLLSFLAPGNALVFTDLVASGARTAAAAGVLADAVTAAGGSTRQFPALTRERMERWINERAAELGIVMGPGAARLLAERVGAYVRESDVDRRRQSELANGELEKLALYRPGGTVSREDVQELVAESVPGSTWAFLDAAAARQGGDASWLANRLLEDGLPLPVLVSQLHRRLRDLIVVREHLDSGARSGDLVRTMRLQPFRAQKLAEQAGAWSVDGLQQAVDGLLELDLRSKGIALDGSTAQMSDARDALGLLVWIAEQAVRRH